MATAENTLQAQLVEEMLERPPLLVRMARMVKRQPLGTFGLLIVLTIIFAAVFAPWIAPYDPEENDFEAMLAALGRGAELRLHTRGAVNNGCTKEEIAEIFLQSAVYAGAPSAVSAFKTAKEVFDEMGI